MMRKLDMRTTSRPAYVQVVALAKGMTARATLIVLARVGIVARRSLKIVPLAAFAGLRIAYDASLSAPADAQPKRRPTP